jgi:hypothetical protein
MSRHEGVDEYEAAVAKFEQHIRKGDDGHLKLVTDPREMGIEDSALLADLVESLEIANEKISRGITTASEILDNMRRRQRRRAAV